MANDYYIPDFGDDQQQALEQQEYEFWLYEIEIEEINKELNCEKYIPSFS